MAEDIVKLHSRPVSPIILVFLPRAERWYQIPRGILQQLTAGAQNTWWVGKFSEFQLKSPFISETVQDRPMVAMEC